MKCRISCYLNMSIVEFCHVCLHGSQHTYKILTKAKLFNKMGVIKNFYRNSNCSLFNQWSFKSVIKDLIAFTLVEATTVGAA